MDNFIQAFTLYSAGNSFILPLLLFAAFTAGILTSLSPCSMGILPLIIAYVGGYSKESNKKLFIQMLSFSLGLSLILSIIGVICAATGKVFTNFASPVIILLFASVLIIMGLSLLEFIEIPLPAIVKKIPKNDSGSLFLFPFLVGVFFALVSSPCSTPILASIMAVAAVSTNIIFSISLLFSFALGQCVIIILCAIFTSILKNTHKIVKYSQIIMKISGVILIIMGIYIWYRIFSSII